MSKPTVIVVGNACTDFFLPPGPWPGRGERHYANLSASDGLLGGNGLNVALVMQALGGSAVELLCGLGHAEQKRNVIESIGARQAGSLRIHDLAQGTDSVESIAFVRRHEGEISVLNIVGATKHITPTAVSRTLDHILEQQANPSFFLLVGLGVLPGLDKYTAELAPTLAALRARGTCIAVDVNLASGDDVNWHETLAPILQHSDYFTPNLDEARQILKKDKGPHNRRPLDDDEAFEEAAALSHELASRFRVRRAVVIKCDKRGCVATCGVDDRDTPLAARTEHIRALPDVDAIDPTGAGDTWLAGFAHHLLRIRNHDWPAIVEAARSANALAARCVQQKGPTTWTQPPQSHSPRQ